jgi:hypothetical protein
MCFHPKEGQATMVKLPVGTKDGAMIKLAVRFKPQVFRKIRARAAKEDKLFSEVLNDIAECGLLDIEDQERDEPPPPNKQLSITLP